MPIHLHHVDVDATIILRHFVQFFECKLGEIMGNDFVSALKSKESAVDHDVSACARKHFRQLRSMIGDGGPCLVQQIEELEVKYPRGGLPSVSGLARDV